MVGLAPGPLPDPAPAATPAEPRALCPLLLSAPDSKKKEPADAGSIARHTMAGSTPWYAAAPASHFQTHIVATTFIGRMREPNRSAVNVVPYGNATGATLILPDVGNAVIRRWARGDIGIGHGGEPTDRHHRRRIVEYIHAVQGRRVRGVVIADDI